MSAVNHPAPDLVVEEWVQGEPSSLERERGRVVLIEVFQVNCPGCFIGGFPEVIDIQQKYRDRPLVVWGLATAFEDFDRNNLANLKKLVGSGEVVGDTLAALGERGLLEFNRLPYRIPFPVAMDKIVANDRTGIDAAVQKIIQRDFPQLDQFPETQREKITGQIRAYLNQKPYDAVTFETYELRGTPSSILIDKKGILRHKIFGSGQGLEEHVRALLEE